jgi:pimeloyl-ACP methyl ester carboxylesterase
MGCGRVRRARFRGPRARAAWDLPQLRRGLVSVRELFPDRRVVAPSRFGYLGSSMPPNRHPRKPTRWPLCSTRSPDQIDVVGLSASATAALQLALRHPGKLKHLVVLVGNEPESPTAVVQPTWATLFNRQIPSVGAEDSPPTPRISRSRPHRSPRLSNPTIARRSTLTLLGLNRPDTLRRSLTTANAAESFISRTRHVKRNVNVARWEDGSTLDRRRRPRRQRLPSIEGASGDARSSLLYAPESAAQDRWGRGERRVIVNRAAADFRQPAGHRQQRQSDAKCSRAARSAHVAGQSYDTNQNADGDEGHDQRPSQPGTERANGGGGQQRQCDFGEWVPPTAWLTYHTLAMMRAYQTVAAQLALVGQGTVSRRQPPAALHRQRLGDSRFLDRG